MFQDVLQCKAGCQERIMSTINWRSFVQSFRGGGEICNLNQEQLLCKVTFQIYPLFQAFKVSKISMSFFQSSIALSLASHWHSILSWRRKIPLLYINFSYTFIIWSSFFLPILAIPCVPCVINQPNMSPSPYLHQDGS